MTQARFVPGHDAKLKSVLLAAFRDGSLSADQMELVAELGWEKFLTPAPNGTRPQGTACVGGPGSAGVGRGPLKGNRRSTGRRG
jgi:hypothetical protein